MQGLGGRYLIQHSADTGKSNSIAWLAHQLIGLRQDGKEIFDSVIVVTDRRILDDQIQRTVKQFMQVGATVGHADHSGDLRRFIQLGWNENHQQHGVCGSLAVGRRLYSPRRSEENAPAPNSISPSGLAANRCTAPIKASRLPPIIPIINFRCIVTLRVDGS